MITARVTTGAGLSGVVVAGPRYAAFAGVNPDECSTTDDTFDGNVLYQYACRRFRGSGNSAGDALVDALGDRNVDILIAAMSGAGASVWDTLDQSGDAVDDNFPAGVQFSAFSDLGNWFSVGRPLETRRLWTGLQGLTGDDEAVIGNILFQRTPDSDAGQLARGELRDLSRYWRPGVVETAEFFNGLDFDGGYSVFRPVRQGLTTRGVRDAVELICEAPLGQSGAADPLTVCVPPTRVNSIEDLPAVESFVRCVADQVESEAEHLVFANVPRVAIDAIQAPAGLGAFPVAGGAYAQQVSTLRQSVLDLPAQQRAFASELRTFAEALRQMESRLVILRNQGKLSSLRLASTISNQLTSCIASSASSTVSDGPGAKIAAAAVCANAVVQIALAVKTQLLEEDNLGQQEAIALSEFTEQFNHSVDGLQAVLTSLRQTQEAIDRSLAGIERTQRSARQAVARALHADSASGGRYYRINTVMRRRLSTTQIRYEEARANAIRLAYLARRAIEQRLGLDLSEVDRNLSLVENPSTWADRLCLASGIDYQRIRDASSLDFEEYAGAFVGDYVRRLESVIESYRLDYPFSDGSDTAVVSLRDEIFRSSQVCDVPGPNLLRRSGALSESDAWVAIGCEAVDGTALGVTGDVVQNCVAAQRLNPGERPRESWPFEGNPPEPFRIAFGEIDSYDAMGGYDAVGNTGTAVAATSSFRWGAAAADQTRLRQDVVLGGGGRYRISWYGRAAGSAGPTAAGAVEVLDPDGAEIALTVHADMDAVVANGWSRHFAFFDAGNLEGTYAVTVSPVEPGMGSLLNQAVDVAGVMLEDVSDIVFGTEGTPGGGSTLSVYDPLEYAPAVYVATGEEATVTGPYCEDTFGDAFRVRNWSRICERVCAPGLARCPEATSAEERCYWQASFHVSHEDIARGAILQLSSFAQDNFNYRVESLGVNVVGTEIRDCSRSAAPSSCYASGSIPFSLEHFGPYPVLDYEGSDTYEAPLFTGRIVHGRGLAAERYLTNPLSSADRALAEPYLHREMRGRPLAGTWRLRIWEEPGLRFDRIEDIQLLLRYRYWTRLD